MTTNDADAGQEISDVLGQLDELAVADQVPVFETAYSRLAELLESAES